MRDYLDQVRHVSQTSLYYLSLEASLVVPDMCSGLESPDGRTTGALYRDWFDKHVAQRYVTPGGPSFTGADCYGLRCAMLHQGRLLPHQGSYKRVVFVEPHGGMILHNNVIDGALNIDVTQFATDMVECAEAWLSTAEHTPEYRANYPQFMQRYPGGLAPYIVGLPVIA